MRIIHCTIWSFALFAAVCFSIVTGCSSKGPAVEKPPTVEVTQLNSTLITPQVVKFQAKIVIQNRGSQDLDFERVDYAVDLFEGELFTSTWDGLKRTKRRGHQTVTFPFQIAMEDILDQAVVILAEGNMDVTFRGTVFPDQASGFGPVPFRDTISIPLPEIPKVSFEGTRGVPFEEEFIVRLKVKNTNIFAISIYSIESFLLINDVKYQLLHTEESTSLEPDTWQIVTLRMENTPGKTLSMVLNTIQSTETEFKLGGTIECQSPYGWILIPIDILAGTL